MEKITDFCEQLLKNSERTPTQTHHFMPPPQKNQVPSAPPVPSVPPVPPVPPSVPISSSAPEVQPTITKLDLENLLNFVRIWTDTFEIEYVTKEFKGSDFETLEDFEEINHLYHAGFFYVRINPEVSILEFFGLLNQIPWEIFRSPGTDQVSFTSLTQLFGQGTEKSVIQLMVLGYYFQLWLIINPYTKMSKTDETTKLLMSGMGNFSIRIFPGYIDLCHKLIENKMK